MEFIEGNLKFIFQESAVQYDEWSFYRNQFQLIAGGVKAVDAHPKVVNQQNIRENMCWIVKEALL